VSMLSERFDHGVSGPAQFNIIYIMRNSMLLGMSLGRLKRSPNPCLKPLKNNLIPLEYIRPTKYWLKQPAS